MERRYKRFFQPLDVDEKMKDLKNKNYIYIIENSLNDVLDTIISQNTDNFDKLLHLIKVSFVGILLNREDIYLNSTIKELFIKSIDNRDDSSKNMYNFFYFLLRYLQDDENIVLNKDQVKNIAEFLKYNRNLFPNYNEYISFDEYVIFVIDKLYEKDQDFIIIKPLIDYLKSEIKENLFINDVVEQKDNGLFLILLSIDKIDYNYNKLIDIYYIKDHYKSIEKYLSDKDKFMILKKVKNRLDNSNLDIKVF